MLIPTKHEKLNLNLLVLGADLISLIKIKAYNLEDLFHELKKKKPLTLDQYYNAILFLSLSEIVQLDKYAIRLKNTQ
ncbi:hypothetical protein HZA75_02980 [Candidatus Roizmanbacteria bacterium]|nr:hypothetical protein [Candidatus Roizmanbacteria bacterium]